MSEPETMTSAHAPDIEEVRQWLQQMIKSLRFGELVVAVIAFVTRMRDVNTDLMKRLADMRRSRPRSETLRRVESQLAVKFGEVIVPVVYEEDSDAEPSTPSSSADTSPSGPSKNDKKKRPSHPGRSALPAHLERVTEVNDVPADLRQFPLCGETMTTVSHSVCEILDVRPAELIVRRRLDERVACPNDDTIVSAPKPPQLIERGKLGTTLIVESLADKYLEHQPIERQCLRWSRTGVDVAPQTLGRGVAAAIDVLSPVARAIQAMPSGPGLLATDATGIPVLDQDAPDGIRQGTMWCWTNAYWVSFIYSAQGDSDSVRRFLGDDHRRGLMRRDKYHHLPRASGRPTPRVLEPRPPASRRGGSKWRQDRLGGTPADRRALLGGAPERSRWRNSRAAARSAKEATAHRWSKSRASGSTCSVPQLLREHRSVKHSAIWTVSGSGSCSS